MQINLERPAAVIESIPASGIALTRRHYKVRSYLTFGPDKSRVFRSKWRALLWMRKELRG